MTEFTISDADSLDLVLGDEGDANAPAVRIPITVKALARP